MGLVGVESKDHNSFLRACQLNISRTTGCCFLRCWRPITMHLSAVDCRNFQLACSFFCHLSKDCPGIVSRGFKPQYLCISSYTRLRAYMYIIDMIIIFTKEVDKVVQISCSKLTARTWQSPHHCPRCQTSCEDLRGFCVL